jgi:DNA (cytosine-5)-methyltransferase 1
LRGYLETGNKKRKGVAPDAGASVEAGCWWDGGQVSQTLDAVLAKGQTMPEKNRFPAVLQPISHWEGGNVHPTLNQSAKGSSGVGSSNQELFSQGGAYLVPGQPTPFRKSKRACSTTDNETWVPADASNTLNNFDLGDTRTTHAIITPHIVQASELRLRGQITEQSTCPTLLANTKSGDNDPLAVQAISFQPGNLARRAGSDPSTEVFPTLSKDSCDQNPHVAIIAPCITASNDPSRSPQSSEVTQQVAAVHQASMAVRRLTPVECERLQGFPDNWSRISWKGKPDTECPDGPRYKACGNSMAVPVMRWIGERIAAVDSKLSNPTNNA